MFVFVALFSAAIVALLWHAVRGAVRQDRREHEIRKLEGAFAGPEGR